MARGREPPAGSPEYPRRRQFDADRAYRPATLASARRDHVWLWICCRNPKCGRQVPLAIAPLIIRLGPDYEFEEFRSRAACSECGHRGVLTMMPSWGGSDIGWMPWPKRFATDDRGITDELNRPTRDRKSVV